MPLPIWPAPTMPTVLMAGTCGASPSLSGCDLSVEFTMASITEPSTVIIRRESATARGALVLNLLQFFRNFGNRFEQIRYQAVVGHLEDRSLGVLVDCDNYLGILHAGEMLNGT